MLSNLSRAVVVAAACCVTAMACTTNHDCSGAGTCTAGSCTCDKPFGGVNCSELVFKAPASIADTYAFKRPNSSSWGGSVVYSPHDQLYHMFSADMMNNCGLDSWQRNSRIVHVVASNPTGPYAPAPNQSGIQQVLAPFSHNPTVHYYPPDQSYFLMHIGSGKTDAVSDPPLHCLNGTTPRSQSAPAPNQQRRSSLSFPLAASVNPGMLVANSLYGPWTDTGGDWSCNNPAATVLRNGTVLLICKVTVDAEHWRQMAVYSAPHPTGEFQLLGASPGTHIHA